MARTALTWSIALVIAAQSGCETAPIAGDSSPGAVRALPGLRYVADSSWEAAPTSSPARAAQYALASGSSDDEAAAELIFYYFGRQGVGSIEANIARWEGQFQQPDGSPAEASTDVWSSHGLRVHTADIDGRYVAEITPGSDERHDKPGYALRGAIIETEAGPYYVKLTGPRAVVARWQSSWQRMLDSLRPAPVEVEAVEAAPGHPQPRDG